MGFFVDRRAHGEQEIKNDVEETNKEEAKSREKARKLIRQVESSGYIGDLVKLMRARIMAVNSKEGPYDGIRMKRRRKNEGETVRQMKSPPEEDLEKIARDLENQKPPIWHR